MKLKLPFCFVVGLCVLFSSGADSYGGTFDSFKGEKGEIKIAGGTAHIPVMKELAKEIMKTNPRVRISIAGGGSGVGIKKVGEGLVDIGNSGRRPRDEEISRYGLSMYKWAIDGVGVVVNPANGVRSLTSTRLKAIFSGEVSNWKTLGGPDKSINIYTRDKASGTRAVFWKKALAKGEISAKANFVKSNGAMKSAIGGDPWGIGYVSVGHIDGSVAAVAIDGVSPTLENVKSGRYKVARGLYSNTKGEYCGLAKKFIECLFTPEGEKIITSKGFIPVR